VDSVFFFSSLFRHSSWQCLTLGILPDIPHNRSTNVSFRSLPSKHLIKSVSTPIERSKADLRNTTRISPNKSFTHPHDVSKRLHALASRVYNFSRTARSHWILGLLDSIVGPSGPSIFAQVNPVFWLKSTQSWAQVDHIWPIVGPVILPLCQCHR
jgi:hypothetical protein